MKNKHKKVRAAYALDKTKYLSGNKVGVLGLIQRDEKIVTLKVIDSAKQTIKEMVKDHVHPSATVVTDSLLAYRGLSLSFNQHEIVHHEKNEFVRGDVYTNTIEGFFSLLKRSIFGIYHQVSHKHLSRYCDETAYRYNTRDMKDGDRFVLSMANMQGRLKYSTLIQKPEENTDKTPVWKQKQEQWFEANKNRRLR